MLHHIDLSQILFLDIECVSQRADFSQVDETMQQLWRHKAKSVLRKYDTPLTDEEVAEAYLNGAAVYAEFGKIICVSVGVFRRNKDDKTLHFHLKSYYSDDEHELLENFAELVKNHYNDSKKRFFCGHNIKEFDMPYLCRRMIVNKIMLPETLQVAGKKPWDLAHYLDTMELWKFGDRKAYTSLKLLAATLGFPSPKDDIDGSEVGRVYWNEGDLGRIARYCEKDVAATAQLYLRYHLEPLLEPEQIVYSEI